MTATSDGDSRDARLQLVSAGARIAAAGLILPGEGNLSVRLAEDLFLLTPTGVDKGRLSAAELVLVSVDGSELPRGASTEALLHRRVYRRRGDVGAIVHAHPPAVQGLAARGRRPKLAALVEAAWMLSAIGQVPSLPAGSEILASAVEEELIEGEACVLEGHGAVTVGGSLAVAVRRMMLLERLASVTAVSAEP